MTKNLALLRREIRQRLQAAGLESAALEARILLQHGLGMTPEQLILNEGNAVSLADCRRLDELTARRLKGEPLDSILGFSSFYGRDFIISKHVLSPRPETEQLVDLALEKLKDVASPDILDLGTGSGAIIVSLLLERPDARGVATDMSEAALQMCRKNAERLGAAERLTLRRSDWFSDVQGTHDLIVSNPPYISDTAMDSLPAEVSQFDPDLALRGGADGLSAYRVIAQNAGRYLNPGGWLLTETGFDQGEAVSEIFVRYGFGQVEIWPDYAGHDRMVQGRQSL